MPINEAIRFLNDFKTNSKLRETLNNLATSDELERFLKWSGYSFSDSEFDDMLRMQLLRCGNEDAANEIKEIGMWYRLQRGIQ